MRLNSNMFAKTLSTISFATVSLFANSSVPNITLSDLDKIIQTGSLGAANDGIKLNDNDIKELKQKYGIIDENPNFKVKSSIPEIKKNSYKLSGDFAKEKSQFSLKNLLVELENIQNKRDHNLHREYPIIFIAKEDLNMYLNHNEYASIKNAYSIDEAIQLINQYTGLSLSYKTESTNTKYAKILNIGIWNDYDYSNPRKYITLEPKESPSYLYGSSNEDKAFFYFKNYNKQYNKEVYFELEANQILDLYEKLLSWGVNKDYYNQILSNQFFRSTGKYKNFDSQKALNELQSNPRISTIQEIRESINNPSSKDNRKFASITVKDNHILENILEQLKISNIQNSYIDSEKLNLRHLKIKLPADRNITTISTLQDLEKYYYFDESTKRVVRLKIINNSYLYDSPKEFTVFAQKDTKQQILHYLDTALESAKNNNHYDFSYEIFKDDIEAIKRGL